MIERRFDRPVGPHALRHLDHARIEHRWLLNLPREDLGPRLIADLERVAETLAHQQQKRIAFALEQRVGGDGRAHPHAGDGMRWQWAPARRPDDVGDTGNSRIRIGLRVLRQQLVGNQPAVRRARHDVGESAAAIDEELPFGAHPMRFSPAWYCFQRLT